MIKITNKYELLNNIEYDYNNQTSNLLKYESPKLNQSQSVYRQEDNILKSSEFI